MLETQTSYLPPICSLKSAPAQVGALFISFITKLRFSGETLSNACFHIQRASDETVFGAPFSCCRCHESDGRGDFRRTTKDVDVLPALVPFHQFSQFHFEQNGEASAIPIGQDTLHANASGMSFQSVHFLLLGNQTMIFLSQLSISSLFGPGISIRRPS